MGVNSLPKTVTRQRRGCDMNPAPSAPESSTLTTRLPSHPLTTVYHLCGVVYYNFWHTFVPSALWEPGEPNPNPRNLEAEFPREIKPVWSL